MQFKLEGRDPRTGKEILKRIPDKPEEKDSDTCGVCDDTGLVEEGQFCHACEKGREMERIERGLPKRSEPPAPFPDQKSAFDQPKNPPGQQLDLFDN